MKYFSHFFIECFFCKQTIILLLFFAVLSPIVVYAQIDYKQLENQLSSMSDDSAKVNVLLTLGEHYCSSENDKALMFLQEAYSISLTSNYTHGEGMSLMWQGRVYYYKSNFSFSNNYLDKAKKPLDKDGNIKALTFWYFAKAITLRITGEYVNAIEMLKKSIEFCKQSGNSKLMTTCYAEIGITLVDRGDVDTAMKYFREGMLIAKKNNNKEGISNVLTSFANAYNRKSMPDSALFYSERALEIRKELGLTRKIASSEKFIGALLVDMGRYVKAEEYLKHALTIFEKLKEKTGIAVTYLYLADVYNRQGKPEAEEVIDKILQIALIINNPNLLKYNI